MTEYMVTQCDHCKVSGDSKRARHATKFIRVVVIADTQREFHLCLACFTLLDPILKEAL